MGEEDQQRIRDLAYSLWESAERPHWSALEYWLMAEQMILGMAIFTNKEFRQRMTSCPTMPDKPSASPGAAAIVVEAGGASGHSFENQQPTGNSLRY